MTASQWSFGKRNVCPREELAGVMHGSNLPSREALKQLLSDSKHSHYAEGLSIWLTGGGTAKVLVLIQIALNWRRPLRATQACPASSHDLPHLAFSLIRGAIRKRPDERERERELWEMKHMVSCCSMNSWKRNRAICSSLSKPVFDIPGVSLTPRNYKTRQDVCFDCSKVTTN